MQYYGKEKSPAEPCRRFFIARDRSYHGATLGALDLSGHESRKALYHKILPRNMHTVPACDPYRNRLPGQTDAEYVQWHREELVGKIEELGPNNVAAFIMEPVVGAVSVSSCSMSIHSYSSLQLKCMSTIFPANTHIKTGPWVCPSRTRISEGYERSL
jgi:adenosylmethionine-8-amino-7-oxononanoate aminotransferase